MFNIALETAMRMRETYTLTADQVRLDLTTIFLDKTKNGDKRQVAISTVLDKLLREYLPGGGGRWSPLPVAVEREGGYEVSAGDDEPVIEAVLCTVREGGGEGSELSRPSP